MPSLTLPETTSDIDALASRILRIIYRYRYPHERGVREENPKFLDQIRARLATSEPVLMCLPAFPFKSPNTSAKVLGHLPDKADEFALAHLNGMCAAIQHEYKPGARLMIISDGLVYNDLLGVPDSNVWAYSEALRAMNVELGHKNIEFSRLKDLTKMKNTDQELDQIRYVSNATNFRLALLSQHGNPEYDASARVNEDEDTRMTYRGYIKFLSTDLMDVYPVGPNRTKSQFKRGIEYIAKEMLYRGDAFARAVRETFPDRLRLSIHPSTGESKISLSLMPTNTSFTTPWHSSIGFNLDGTSTTGHHVTFDEDEKYELVYKDERPYYYREKTDLLDWGQHKITCDPMYPTGLMIRPADGPGKVTIDDIPSAKWRALAEHNSPIVLRGIGKTRDRELLAKKAYELGVPAEWAFGLILEVKDRGEDTRGLNNVLSDEWMPYHYDGLFKTVKKKNEDGSEKLVSVPPRFQLFTGYNTSPKDTGFTLFSSSPVLFQYLPENMPLEYLRTLTWSVRTSSFKACKLQGLPLVTDHPATGAPCFRFHEPWPQSKTKFDETHVSIENPGERFDSETICDALTELLHDRRVSYYHTWENGDLVVSDNVLAMHTRSGFVAGCNRELWRINFD